VPASHRNFALFVVLTFVLGTQLRAWAQSHTEVVQLRVDSVLATDSGEGVDTRLADMGRRLRALFPYNSYRLVSHQQDQAQCGSMVAFTLPGGEILHIEPREVDGDMVALKVVLFQGPQPTMTTEFKLRNHGVLFVGGPRYRRGMLIISINVDTPAILTRPALAATVEATP